MKERKELIASCPSGNPDYQYYLKVEADQVLDAQEAKITGLEYQLYLASKRIKKLEVINKDLIEDRNKTYNIYESRIKELEAKIGKPL